MRNDMLDGWDFETNRLSVGPWHEAADQFDLDLSRVVSEMLTIRTTVALPESWQGEQSVESARGWITDRDADSWMLLVTESALRRPVGILVLAEVPMPGSGIDLRIGYLFAETSWGQGLATELVSGLIDWARTQPRIRTLTGGVDPANQASVRVLEKCGFRLIDGPNPAVVQYQFEISPSNDWDCHAKGWNANNAARAHASAAFASLRRLLRDANVDLADAKVIDFGCGTGLLTEHMVRAGAAVEAVDTSTAMLDVVDTKITAHGWTGVRTSKLLPVAHAAFDLVVCSSVCSFLDDYPATAEALVARLRDGGLFVQWDWERTDDDSHGLTRTEIEEALVAAGLVEVEVSEAFRVSIEETTVSPIMGHGQRPLDITRR